MVVWHVECRQPRPHLARLMAAPCFMDAAEYLLLPDGAMMTSSKSRSRGGIEPMS